MKPISADTIDRVIDELDNLSEDQYEQRMQAFSEAQPMLLAWLETESFDFLTEDEKGYLEYLALIIWSAVVKGGESPEPAEEDAIGTAEEANYDVMEQTAGKPFRDRLDPFFEGYAQEDLLAFAEEAVLEDEEDPESLVTKEGREVIFVSLKTVIDVLT